jgi:hypothetical protein
MNRLLIVFALVLSACAAKCSCSSSTSGADAGPTDSAPMPDAGPPSDAAPTPAPTSSTTTKVTISNLKDAAAVVNVSVGSDSVVQPSAWTFCGVDAGLTCSFTLAASAVREMSTGGKYLNASIAFNGPVGCGSTIAEFTANNPNGFGTADVSLVNGWSNNVRIYVDGHTLGPSYWNSGPSSYGVFPAFCDVCVAEQSPPCGKSPNGCTTPGSCGCKTGTQYNPTVPCQVTYQQADAGSLVNVALVP